MPGRLSADDRAEILELHARYAWAIDTNRPELVGELFTPDGIFDGWGGYYVGRDEVLRMAAVSREHDGDHRIQHWIANAVFDGDEGRCSVKSMCIGPSAVGGGSVLAFVGYYVDDCVKVAGRWLYAKRRWRPWQGEVVDGGEPWITGAHDGGWITRPQAERA